MTGTFPCGQQVVKYDYSYKEKADCTLCKKAHEENGSSWKGELTKETIGHIQSAGCLGQKEVVTAAHNACIRELLQAIKLTWENGYSWPPSGRSSQWEAGTTNCVCRGDVWIGSC